MGKRKQQSQPPSKPQEFRSTPFSSLKGIGVVSAPVESQQPPAKVSVAQSSPDDGTDLFLMAMDGVRKLGDVAGGKISGAAHTVSSNRTAVKNEKTVPKPPIDPVASELFMQEIGRLKLEVQFTEQLPDEDELKPLSGNRLKQLKRGIISVDYQLDLHGLTRDEALAELPRFLRSARQRGQSAALVITGKGLNSVAEPVLQQAVAGWLRDAGRELVAEYAPAPREMGGSGAFVVFLRPMVKPAGRTP
jgi:DNA-nicking Smr family endonuclease